jgi:hypothetical protein
MCHCGTLDKFNLSITMKGCEALGLEVFNDVTIALCHSVHGFHMILTLNSSYFLKQH